MLHQAKFIRVALVFLSLFIWLYGFATHEKYINGVDCHNLPSDSIVAVQDTGYSSNRALIEQDYLRQNVVSVFLNENTTSFISSPFTAKIYVQYIFQDYAYPANTNTNLAIDSFTIQYDSSKSFSVRDYRVFNNIYTSKVKITGVTADVSWDVSRFIRVTNEIFVNRAYKWADCSTIKLPSLSNNSLALEVNNQNTVDKFDVSWGPVLGADEYDLEWAYEDYNPVTGFPAASTTIFKNNATRVSVISFGYSIPLLYDGKGKLHYRVRPVKIKQDGQRIEGQWSSDAASPLGLRSVEFNGFQRKLNWQSTTSFAEEGKRKSVVNYFDGSLRSRQTVTKDNTTDTTIVAETFYDYQGRAAIQVLPSPTLQSLLTYSVNFNRANRTILNDAAYDKDDFDKLNMSEAACGKAANAMSSLTSGAAKYYSFNNSLLSASGGGFHKYIPDAQGYPFTQTEYTLDNTGRISRQGGVGPVHQLGKHDTRYYYGKPSQEELDGLFGTEVGYAGHYFKNMVRDANGQYSISYVDMHGRTIATSLAGTPPDSIKLDKLSSNTIDVIRESLLENNSQIIDGYSIKTSKGLVVPKAGEYKIEYQLKAPKLTVAACDLTPICYDCLYDLNIKVISDCGDTYLDVVIPKIGIDTSDYESGVNDFCDAPDSVKHIEILNLSEGSYLISKTLTIRKESIDEYRDAYFMNYNLCRTFQDFLQEAIQEVKSNVNCVPTCTACNAALGTQNSFIEDYMAKMGIISVAEQTARKAEAEIAYKNAKSACDKLCVDSLGDHNAIRQEMLQDMTPPYGQYARNDSVYRTVDNKNIFYFDGTLMRYQYFSATYKDENGKLDTIVNNQGQRVTPNQLTEDEFVANFKTSWAESLLPGHPEYCKLTKVMSWASTYSYDEGMKAVDTYAEALNKGYLNPTGKANLVSKFGNGLIDPALSPLSIFSSSSSLELAMLRYDYNQTNTNQIDTINIWTLAYQTAVCNDPDNTPSSCLANRSIAATFPSTMCEGDLNMAWRNFRELYLQVKAKLIFGKLNDACGIFNSYPYTPPSGTAYDRYTTNFPDPTNTGGIAGINAGTNTVSSVRDEISGAQLAQLVALNCNSYVDTWMEKLAACKYSPTQWTELKNRLLGICKAGGDVQHIGGASSFLSGGLTYTFVQNVEQFNYSQSPEIQTNANCNGYLLTVPLPYHAPLTTQVNQITYVTTQDKCLCDNLAKYHLQFTQSTFGDASFGAYLRRTLQITTSDDDINTLYNQCLSSITPTCKYLVTPISIPPALSNCMASGYVPPCINCLKADSLYKQFKRDQVGSNITPSYDNSDSTQQANNRYFSNYMNYYTGFNYTTAEYLQFLDSCKIYGELSDTACTSLQTLIKNYQAGTVNESCSTAKWKINTAFTTIQAATFCDGVSNGTLHVPTAIRNDSAREFNFIDTNFCLPNEFSIETRLKAAGASTPYNISIGVIYQDASGSDLTNPKQYISLDLAPIQHPSYGKYWVDGTGTNNTDLATDLETWHILRIQKTNTNYKFYVDGTLKLTIPTPPGHYGQRHLRFSILAYNTAAEVDWVKIYNSMNAFPFGKLIYDEGFNSNVSFAKVDKQFVCNSNCQTAFVNYYNSQRGTSLTYQQISSLYRQSCGKELNVCDGPSPCESILQLNTDFPKYYSSIKDQSIYSGTVGDPAWEFGLQIPWWSGRDYYYNSFRNIKPYIDGGVFTFSTDYDNSLEEASIAYRTPRPICLQNAYTIEFRAKNNHVRPDNSVLYGRAYTVVAPGITYELINEPTPWIWCRSGTNNGTAYYLPGLTGLNDWVTMKVEVKTDSIRVYYNGGVILRFLRTDNSNILTLDKFGLNMNLGFQKQIDWYKVYNSQDQLVFHEDFNDTLLSIIEPSALCPVPACDAAYTYFFNRTRGTYYYNYQSIKQLYLQTCDSFPDPCSLIAGASKGNLTLCGRSNALFPDVVPGDTTDCYDTTQLAIIKATIRFRAYQDSLKNTFDTLYMQKCLTAANYEQLHLTRPNNEYHYTLYYYDQAGGLVKTVPPAGVHQFKNTDSLAMVRAARETDAATPLVPPHTLATFYRYNSLNQVVVQKTPDAGISHFWYDVLGRLALSQNAKQIAGLPTDAAAKMYSYTLYDKIGRIAEVGEVVTKATTPDRKLTMRDPVAFGNWLNSYTTYSLYRRQITRTLYDLEQVSGQLPVADWFSQNNLRNRVSYSQVIDQDAAPIPAGLHGTITGTPRASTYYSYDIHGNVFKLLQHYNAGIMKDNPASNINQFKLVQYDYDLISGKVNMVSYQPSYVYGSNLVRFPDRFYHKYDYDAENRLTHVYTSADSVYWELDGRYEYYRHGPLARMILGQQQVQGVDYAYTLQGWLKGINGTSAPVAGGAADMGGDAATGTSVAQDVVSYSLHYHSSDYAPIGGNNATLFAAVNSGVLSNEYRPLYNGNISSMAVNMPALGSSSAKLYNYKYDQLNRITGMDAWTGLNSSTNSWAGATKGDAFKEQVAYDPNGNILTYFRNGGRAVGSSEPIAMDDMTYSYYAGTNKLKRVTDTVNSANFNTDIDNQAETENYIYDEIGNLVTDKSEKLKKVNWNVYGKILDIEKGTNATAANNTRITYTYDAAGNRISKQVQKPGQQGAEGITTWYVRDAQGNVLSTYNYGNSQVNNGLLTQTEVHLYGSSRLGMWKPARDVQATYTEPLRSVDIAGTLYFGNVRSFMRGKKLFELSNHLGNVLATISDKKSGVAGTGGNISSYKADVITVNDYYPFGMAMPERGYAADRLDPSLANYALTLTDQHAGVNGKFITEAFNNFTVEFLVKPVVEHEIDVESNTGFGGTAGQKYVIFPDYAGDNTDGNAGMGVSVGTNGVSVYEHAEEHMPAILVWASPTPLTAWTHVAVVYTNKLPSLYINGVLVRTAGAASPRNKIYPTYQFPGGYYGTQAGGQLDEVRIWGVARSQAEIAANMNTEVAPNSANLLGYWPMNEGGGLTLTDVSGHNRNIDLTNGGYAAGNWTSMGTAAVAAKAAYRYGFNGQEHSTEIGDDSYTAEFWEYDSRIGRRWNVDPVSKEYESPYAALGNTPIGASDPNGADSIFYNSNGKQNRRVKKEGDHTYFLMNTSGNITIYGNKHYQGNSYYSFFGDPEKFDRPTLFTEIDNSIISTEQKVADIVDKHVRKGDDLVILWKESPHHQHYDYKNSVLDQDGNIDAESNLTTAYLFDGILYNRNEAGNILWGATTAKMRVNDYATWVGITAAHYKNELNGEEVNESNAIFMGRNLYSRMRPQFENVDISPHFSLGPFRIRMPLVPPTYREIRVQNRTYTNLILSIPTLPLLMFSKTPGVDPTNKKGLYYDEWDGIR